MIREPIFTATPLTELRPTQITVGLREVAEKRKGWRAKHGAKAGEFLGTHMIPVVLGPKDRRYVTDHHHLALALRDEGVEQVATTIVLDLSRLEPDAFWVVLDNRGLMHPFDKHGKRQGYRDIPSSIDDLIDDPYRSLAGGLRRLGGYAKDTTPFSEFLWADFLRRRIDRKAVEKHYERALDDALKLARGKDADYLPGWCGPIDD
ncbi:MAG TPA: ParB-like protein [Stellaceae bacterium]|nr:ParB-like protein [Stellaceae bacterium]